MEIPILMTARYSYHLLHKSNRFSQGCRLEARARIIASEHFADIAALVKVIAFHQQTALWHG
jgi:hypothetical protein